VEAAPAQIRVIIADDDPMARRALREGLSERGLVVIADLADGAEAVGLCVHYRPDVVLMDLMMPGMDGVGATREVVRRVPQTKVLLITRSENAGLALVGLRAGAAGFMRKDTDLDVLADAVRRTAAGQAMVDPQIVAALIDDLRLTPAAGVGLRPVSSPLTDREWEVLDALCVGLNAEQIAEKFVLSLETVRSHVKSIFRKIGVHSQADAIAAAEELRRPAGPLGPHRDGR
jgi:DNA-binding NarL/FixJ family response regulator